MAIAQRRFADTLNALRKYVVSSTLEDPVCSGSTVLGGDVVREVVKLKERIDGEIVVYASRPLVRTLIEHDLVDELRLMIYRVSSAPANASSAKQPLRNGSAFSAVGRTVGDSLAYLTYEILREP